MPMKCFIELMTLMREEQWFEGAEKPNALGQEGAPLEFLVLGALRYLGRGWTFDDLEDATGISEETHRRFFHKFIKACRLHLFPKFVTEPTTEEEIADAMAEFTEAGFDGCIGSADATHIIMERCSARLKNQHTGGKLSQTARAFEITVNHRRRILSTTVGFPGRWNDKTVVRFDSFINRIHRGLLYENVKYDLYKSDGTKYPVHGAWILECEIFVK
jgi:Plant transposon protein